MRTDYFFILTTFLTRSSSIRCLLQSFFKAICRRVFLRQFALFLLELLGYFMFYKNKYNKHHRAKIKMNILSNEEMKEKQKKLLRLYDQSGVNFKINLQQLLEAKKQKRNFFCFKKASNQIKLWMQKLVPLNKNVQTISLYEQQNGLFKALTYIFLLIIYRQKTNPNQYLKDQLKCSLYSDDIDLLEVKNHSFNKKMKSDSIKSVMVFFFKQIEYLFQSDLIKRNNIKPEQLIGFALQKNDMIVEGFHLFYRNILAKLQVQNANNCIEQVNPEEAISNLIEYFQIECRTFSDLFLFSEGEIFIAEIQQHTLVFGRYYENELKYQDTSQEQGENVKQISQNDSMPQHFQKGDHQIQKQDVRIFNFILDTDRTETQISQSKFHEKSGQNQTPCFNGTQDFKFGRKTSCDRDKQLEGSITKIKDRLQSQRINEIQSQQEDLNCKNQAPTPFLGGPSTFNFQPNKFLNFAVDQDEQSEYEEESDNFAPTPMLGGAINYNFGPKQPNSRLTAQNKISESIQVDDFQNKLNTNQNADKKAELLIDKKQIKQSAVRRQSYQGQNSSKSKSSGKKKLQMKTSKNQIKVIDQTASRTSLAQVNDFSKRYTQQFVKQRKQTIGYMEKMSSYSNCTCNLQKKNKIKLQPQIIEMVVQCKHAPSQSNNQRKISDQISQNGINKALPPQNNLFENKKYVFKTQCNQRVIFKNQIQKCKSPTMDTSNQQNQQKRQQFLNFLKKDKSQLIKKLSEKRHAKHNTTNAYMPSPKFVSNQTKNTQQTRKFVKQSMFVGSYHLYNPENKGMHEQKNRAVTPTQSIDKKQAQTRNGNRQRSITPNQHVKRELNTQGMKLFKVNHDNHKNSIQISNNNYQSNNVNLQPKVLSPKNEKQHTLFKSPFSGTGSIRQNSEPFGRNQIQYHEYQSNQVRR